MLFLEVAKPLLLKISTQLLWLKYMFNMTSVSQQDYIWAKLHTIRELKAIIIIKGSAEQS